MRKELNNMDKKSKKRRKLQERIEELEMDLRESLTKKTSATAEINVGEYQRKIADLRKQLQTL